MSVIRNTCLWWHERHTWCFGGPAAFTTFAFSAWHVAHTFAAGIGLSCGLWQLKQLSFMCPSGPSRISCVSSFEWHLEHTVLVSAGLGACGLWHEVQSLWR